MRNNFVIAVLLLVAVYVNAEKWHTQVSVIVPGTITMSDSISNVLLVNNSVVQPSNYGQSETRINQSMTNIQQEQDSSAFYCLLRTAELLEQSERFESVSLYEMSKNESGKFFELTRLSAGQVQQMKADYQADALMVLNRLVLISERQSVQTEETKYAAALDMRSLANWTVYLPKDNWKAHNLAVMDTLSWEYENADETVAWNQLPELKEALIEGAIRAGERVCKQLFPHEEMQDRYLFTSKDANIQAGFQLFRQQKWPEAVAAFNQALNSKKVQVRAMATANIAVCEELMGNPGEAVKAAEEAKNYFMKSQASASTEAAQIMQWYSDKLKSIH